jgi:hypothetical protein
MKEYVVTFPRTVQIAEDRWQVINPSLKVTDETTIAEIRKWVLSNVFLHQPKGEKLSKQMEEYNLEVTLISLEYPSNG